MGWKKWSCSERGGIIGLSFVALMFIEAIVSPIFFGSSFNLAGLFAIMVYVWYVLLSWIQVRAVAVALSISLAWLSFYFFGYFVGWIIGRVKR